MGALISRFRKKKSTPEQLEEIEKELKHIQEFQHDTQRKQRKIIGSFVVYSVIIYVMAALLFYFYYFPSELFKQLLYSIPLLVFPVLVYVAKKVLNWYFKNQIIRQEDEKAELRRKKRKILDAVMETETYKVAKDILEKYDPDYSQKKLNGSSLPGISGLFANQVPSPSSPTSELRRRSMPVRSAAVPPMPRPLPAALGGVRPPKQWSPPPAAVYSQPRLPGQNLRPPGPPLPRPVPPRERSIFDRFADYVMGEGPGNKYALICQRCQSHNGLASPYEYEYVAFRCCYCYHWNPARKLRPMAPRLPNPPEISASGDSADRQESDTRPSGSSASEGETSDKGSRSRSTSPVRETTDNEEHSGVSGSKGSDPEDAMQHTDSLPEHGANTAGCDVTEHATFEELTDRADEGQERSEIAAVAEEVAG